MASREPDVLSKILGELRGRGEEARVRAAKDLRQHVSTVSRELSGEAFTKFINDVNRRIFELVNGTDSVFDKIGGIMAIDQLIDIDGEDNTTKISRFANYLRIVLPGTDPQVSELAAKALGRLALAGGTLTAEFVEFEVKRALEWLQAPDRHEARRHASVLILREMAQNAPTLFYPYVSLFFENIWVAFRDSKVVIREGAADALRACLELISQRESQQRPQWYQNIYDESQKGLKQGTPESVHGSLLAIKELLTHTGMFLGSRYNEVCDTVVKLKEHKDALVRRSVIGLFPLLAQFDPATFASAYLSTCMNHLLAQLKKDKERSPAFIAIGSVAIAMGTNISPYLEPILALIKEGLAPKGRGKFAIEAPVFVCIAMLSRAVGPALTKQMHQLLDQMFSGGLSQPLTEALEDLGRHIPSLLPAIQEKLLDILSQTLTGAAYRHPGAPSTPRKTTTAPAVIRDTQGLTDSKDVETVTLALRTLGNFDFTGHSLNEFVRECVVSYLEDDHVDVRKAAAETCCKLLAKQPTHFQGSNHSNQIVGEVLEKLLTVGIADPDPSIRQVVLCSLDERFDRHLAQAENIRSLFTALNDEVFEIRELSIAVIGRLTGHNPACVLPSLRKALIQLLTELEYSTVSRSKEESALLLGRLMSASKSLIKPYAEPILKVALLPKLRDPSPGVAARVMTALGELAQVAGSDMNSYIPELMPLIIDTLQDQSSAAKREAALSTLGKLVNSTGYVIDPYVQYPNLMVILTNFLKTEQQVSIRRETVKVLGILGALDPYKHKLNQMNLHISDKESSSTDEEDVDHLLIGMSTSSEDYHPTVAIHALMKILRDPSLSTHHTAVIQAVMFIFKTLGLKCVPFLSQIMPPFMSVMRSCPQGMIEFHFNKLSQLVTIVKQHIRNYLDDIFALIKEYWTSNQVTIIALIKALAVALDGEFKVYLPRLLPLLLQVFETDDSEKRLPTLEVLTALKKFGATLEEYLHLVIPVIVRLFERPDVPLALRKSAIQTVGQLCKKINFSDYASRIIHPLARTLATSQDLRLVAMDTLAALVYQLGTDYAIFIPMINKVLVKNRIMHQRYDLLVSRLIKNEPMPQELGNEVDDSLSESNSEEVSAETGSLKKLPVHQQKLKKAWETSQRSTKDDWNEWVRRFSVELLKESPSHALRACSTLAAVFYPLARELFNAAFVSCWTELYDQFQDELVKSMETALLSPTVPPEILQTILNLAEFMEHDDKPLPIAIKTLGVYSAKCHAYAKALHYKELEYLSSPSTSTIEALISINNQLQQPDAAVGILKQKHNLELKESWYEKLHRWEDALAAYDAKQLEDPLNFDLTLGRMRCLNALGDWERLSHLSQEKWLGASEDQRKVIAPLGAAAAWGLWQWEVLDDYISIMKEDTPDGAFFRAILALHRNQFVRAHEFIDKTRDLLDTELTALVGESYNRSYNVVVRVQMLAELEEIIQYKRNCDEPESQAFTRATWMKRLSGCQRNVEVWQRILKVRCLVVSPQEDETMWIKFANLCRKSGRYNLAQKTLTSLFGQDPAKGGRQLWISHPNVTYSYLKFSWLSGNKQQAFNHLSSFTELILGEVHKTDQEPTIKLSLLARCYLKLGEWKRALNDDAPLQNTPQIIENFLLATKYDKNWYKAWHSYALSNFEVVSQNELSGANTAKSLLTSHIIPSIQGFFRSISLSHGNSLQDTLRLLTLWFKYGHLEDAYQAISEGFNDISIDTWLQVIPQVIARIHSPSASVRHLIHLLLAAVGKEHPQALIYPVTVASKSQSSMRSGSAKAILDKMRQHSPNLVEQAQMVSEELIRVAILWHEMWHEGLEEASRLYFGDRNVEGMFAILEPLHKVLDKGPETLRETSFQQAYGRDLQEAHEWSKKYRKSNVAKDINYAWDLYYAVFRKINKQLPQLTTLEFQYVSPKLLQASNLELAVPGTYKSGEQVVMIASFVPTVNVITSKQRPRKLTIKGSDGKEYRFLLKGHEDLRQDERVMQLFSLVNTLLATDPETFKRHLNIHRYAVIPLSPNSGLIGWVPHCDTLHSLIRDFRESRKILLNIEHRLMLQMAPDYDHLTLIQKVEVFRYGLDNTTGQDLYKVLWLKSKNSEAWLDRRTNYTRSLAVMSMVGYILGLGDRHPSNLMLERYTGKIIHIDFGDCFVAGTPITLQCGLSRPIESFERFGGASVLAGMTTEPGEGQTEKGVRIPVGTQTRMLVRGERDVVRVTMSDGTSVTCTPEHKFMTSDGEWAEVQHLVGKRIAVGLAGPLDQPAEDEFGWTLSLGPWLAPLKMNSPAARDRSLAFARVSGYMMADGSVSAGDGRAACTLGSRFDSASFVADCELVFSHSYSVNRTEPGAFVVALPAAFMEALKHVGHPSGGKIAQEATLPSYVLQPACPRSIQREFLAGLFGGDGWSPQLVNDGKGKKNGALSDKGFRLRGVKFMHHIEPEFEGSMVLYMNNLVELLNRCGVPGAVVENSIKATRDTSVEIRLRVPASSDFARRVGFRHCVHKQLRLAAATSFWSYKELLGQQHESLVARAVTLLKETPSMQAKPAIQRAVDEARTEGITLLPGAIPMPDIISRRLSKPDTQANPSKLGMTPLAYMRSIGALGFWNTEGGAPYAMSQNEMTLPSYSLQVLSLTPAGKVPTYDLSVDKYTSFLANGLVVHNCFEVAMQRDKFPEKIPFRLTRMLINAMEVSGIEGNFRITCENVMRVLRENKDSLMAVLEAFVHDPLINWRLLTQHTNGPSPLAAELTNGFEYSSSRKGRSDVGFNHAEEQDGNQPEALNTRALQVINRVSGKLTGRDFKQNEVLDVPSQVERLIQQATSTENLCQCYIGWCPFW